MLESRFFQLMKKYCTDNDYITDCWNEIVYAYTQESRYYHNLEHLSGMLVELNEVISPLNKLDTLLFSLYYHDFVYKVIRQDNEHKSALVFQKKIGKTSFPYISECMKIIEATKDHKKASDFDTNLFLDLDLSIFGKDAEVYREYSRNIRREFQEFPDFLFRRNRKKVLERYMEMDSIFKTNYFISRYEFQARANIQAELAAIKNC